MSTASSSAAWPDAAPAFHDELDHLRAELDRVEARVASEVRAARSRPDGDEFAGVFVSDAEIEWRLEGEADARGESGAEEAGAARTRIEERVAVSAERGIRLPLRELVERFELDPRETDILLFCLAPEVRLRFQRYYAYLQNDAQRGRASAQLLARLVLGAGADVLEIREALSPDRPLRAGRLLHVEPGESGGLAPESTLRVDGPVVGFLAGLDELDAGLAGAAAWSEPAPLEPIGSCHDHHRRALAWLLRAPWPARAHLAGAPGSGRSDIVAAFAHAIGRRVIRVPLPDLCDAAAQEPERVGLLLRDARLHAALLHVSDVDRDADLPERGRRLQRITRALVSDAAVPVLFSGRRRLAELEGVLEGVAHEFALPIPSIRQRIELWTHHLGCEDDPAGTALAAEIASRFAFTPARVREVVDTAVSRSQDGRVSFETLFACCRDRSSHGLLHHARHVRPVADWNQLVLPADRRRQLEEVCSAVRNRCTVNEDWRFDASSQLGRGLFVLFSGAPGTGKTLAAEVLASELGLDLFQLDASRIVSRFVGDAERAIRAVFDEAETASGIVFVDECDGLMPKRSTVKDAQDKYSNSSLSVTLQCMDRFEGVLVLATNLTENLDPALMRRMSQHVEFPLPDEATRERIWHVVIPSAAPLSDDVDFGFLASRFKIAGGNIRNAARNAAYLAADAGQPIGMLHLVRALRREYQKIGRLSSRSEFGPYHELLDEDAP